MTTSKSSYAYAVTLASKNNCPAARGSPAAIASLPSSNSATPDSGESNVPPTITARSSRVFASAASPTPAFAIPAISSVHACDQ